MDCRKAALILAATGLLGAAGPPPQTTSPPSGFLCDWAILLAIDEVQRQCAPDADPAFAAALRDALSRMRVHATGKGAMPAAAADRFERQMRDADNPSICKGDGPGLFGAFRTAGTKGIEELASKSLAKPLTLEFGACL